MAKEKEADATHQEPPRRAPFERGIFLFDPEGAKTYFKVHGDAEDLDDFKVLVKALYEEGYQPDGKSQAEKATAEKTGVKSSGGNPETKPCPIHDGSKLYRKTNAKGTWYSHKNPDGDGYCNGKGG